MMTQQRYRPSGNYNRLVLQSVERNTPFNADHFAQADIERPSLIGRMIEANYKEPET